MKAFVAHILLLTLIIPLGITVGFLKWQQKQIRREVKREIINQISLNQLTRLRFSKYESEKRLDWIHSHEFSYQGNLYDVVKTETHDSFVVFWCWPDKKETALNHRLHTILIQQLEQNNQRNTQKSEVVALYLKLFYESLQTYIPPIPNTLPHLYFPYELHIPEVLDIPNVPPPRC